ncbi:MAG: hypothetical protein NC112_04800 [Oxalobacter formigenes]|nr:hypothetical protein [Oxalobacter formigenes]
MLRQSVLILAVALIAGMFHFSCAEDTMETNEEQLPCLLLNNGESIPRLGLGTFMLQEGNEAYNAVLVALMSGYRHIDTAHAYGKR